MKLNFVIDCYSKLRTSMVFFQEIDDHYTSLSILIEFKGIFTLLKKEFISLQIEDGRNNGR
ncbi:MAG: hypothetical protein ACFFCZ_26495 [Promethearchaeota archaeon]